MPKRIAESDRVIAFFATAPLEEIALMMGAAQEIVRRRKSQAPLSVSASIRKAEKLLAAKPAIRAAAATKVSVVPVTESTTF